MRSMVGTYPSVTLRPRATLSKGHVVQEETFGDTSVWDTQSWHHLVLLSDMIEPERKEGEQIMMTVGVGILPGIFSPNRDDF